VERISASEVDLRIHTIDHETHIGVEAIGERLGIPFGELLEADRVQLIGLAWRGTSTPVTQEPAGHRDHVGCGLGCRPIEARDGSASVGEVERPEERRQSVGGSSQRGEQLVLADRGRRRCFSPFSRRARFALRRE
jgi:hypothetical protein